LFYSGLELVFLAEEFTMECVEQLAKMEKLKYLQIMISSKNEPQPHIPALLAHAAGKLHSLEVFDFKFICTRMFEGSVGFVEQFSKLYPGKKLTLLELRFVLYFYLYFCFLI